ncbi:MAG TPA: phospho-N-acetylmuramoyl-pentapeptide-transferase [Tissierellia bacterium]|jgi:phospho-N-acetylmuramoyl-pentapeptide-transferase|nr:phospho-N-acetylmuramoyl-pentapeptide-transferase [Tissierellia bacterium]
MSDLILFVVTLLLGLLAVYLLIPLLHSLRFGQNVYELAPETHQKKQGIPTMGGIAFIGVSTLVAFVYLGLESEHVFLILGMLLFAIVGFVDDSMKLFFGRNLGLKASHKLVLQILMGALMAFLLRSSASSLLIPLTNRYLNLGILYYPFVIVFYLAMTNSTNLTDGIDGLLASVSLLVLVFVLVVSWDLFRTDLFRMTLIFAAALLAYLYYNRYPAKLMMGDTGSMAIGGFIATSLLVTGTALYALIVGIIYVAESLSLILQVWSWKTRRKRIFKMSPIHHHFELSGYSENMIVLLFSGVTLVGVLLGILFFKV